MTSDARIAPARAGLRPARRYVALDGLRGLAAIMVVAFHLFEANSGGGAQQRVINHGYLAVDFFFLLSGFVIAHAYDARWAAGMSAWAFYRRRLLRLQPLIVLGALLGAATLGLQQFPTYPKLADASAWRVAAATLVACLMIPLPRSADIRGWEEAYPLNGPAWSLFYEYIANILYASVLRKLSNRALAALVAVAAAALAAKLLFGERGDLVGGWSLDAGGVRTGLVRVMFPFLAGVLLSRLGARIRAPRPFLLSSLLLLAALAMPRLGGTERLWLNGLYEALCVVLLFPLIVAIGAGVEERDEQPLRGARLFGDLSYPLYVTHFPLIYIYTGWVSESGRTTLQTALVGAAVFIAALALAWACLRLYDEPLRRRLARRPFRASSKPARPAAAPKQAAPQQFGA